jgi:hypothetical protein
VIFLAAGEVADEGEGWESRHFQAVLHRRWTKFQKSAGRVDKSSMAPRLRFNDASQCGTIESAPLPFEIQMSPCLNFQVAHPSRLSYNPIHVSLQAGDCHRASQRLAELSWGGLLWTPQVQASQELSDSLTVYLEIETSPVIESLACSMGSAHSNAIAKTGAQV